MAIVPLDEVWVTANFKETQLQHMRPGQRVDVKVDAYGGRTFNGHVDSIAAATGARFSLLPPENATGNFVKVVQRVPVKIVLDAGPGSRASAPARACRSSRRCIRSKAGCGRAVERAARAEARHVSMTEQRQINPWLIAVSVMFATFMEVLDTTVVNVSLPHIAGSLSVDDRRSDVGADVVPGRQRDHPADDRLARERVRPQAAADAVGRRLHGGVVPVRPGADARLADLSSASSRARPAARCSRSRRPCCSKRFRRRTAARPWASGASASSSRRFSGRCSAAGSPTTTAGAGSSTSTSRSASRRS